MLRSFIGLIIGLVISLIVGAIAIAVLGYTKLSIADVSCKLQTNNTYTCDVTEKVWSTNYIVREKQVENVVGIQSNTSNSCKRNCARRVNFLLTSGEEIPIKNSYGDADLAYTMVTTLTEKIENKEKEIFYTVEIHKFWDLYFPIAIIVIVVGAMIFQSFAQFVANLRHL